jgi:gentisate 1,2-dioxygenase
VNLYDELVRLRDEQRQDRQGAPVVIRGRDLPWEVNPQGIMQWYMHPCLPNQALRTYLFFTQRIPPQSRSGRQRCQGGVVHFVWAGRGHTEIDGVRYSWKKGDVLQLPLRTNGVIFQHFNDSPDEDAVLIACEANTVHALGVDKGIGFEQLEEAPEYRQGM